MLVILKRSWMPSPPVLAVIGTAWATVAGVLTGGTLQVVIEPCVGDEPLRLHQSESKTEASETWTATRLSYLVSGVFLQREDDSWLRLPETVDWMNAATQRNTLDLDDVPSGTYKAIRFHVGVDARENATDPATRGPDHPLNPRINGLHWSWQGGYIFLALEGNWRGADGQTKGYAFHLGGDAFRTEVTLPCSMTLPATKTVVVQLDLATVLKGVSFDRDGATTHSREGDALAVTLRDNLRESFRLASVNSMAAHRSTGAVEAPPGIGARRPLAAGASFPQPKLPGDNPLTDERMALGRMLFNEKALSRDGTISCASCHDAKTALTDPARFSTGLDGRVGDRNAMPLFNLAWKDSFFWDGRAASLREQALIPIEDHREMDETVERVLSKLKKQERYSAAFRKAFGTPDITAERLGMAIENFLLTLTSHHSKFDRSRRGEETLTADEQRGFELFMMEREPRLGTMGADCFHCHGGALFTDHQFRNNGLPINPADTGRHRVTGVGLDRGTFATPSLRNIALTAPYMHDGRFSTLEEVLDHYSEGVKRTPTLDPNLAKHPDGGLHLSAEDKRCVIAFLHTLTDIQFAERALPESE